MSRPALTPRAIARLLGVGLLTVAALVALRPAGSARADTPPDPPGLPFPFPFPTAPVGSTGLPLAPLPTTPTGGTTAPTGGNPLSGLRFFVDPQTSSAKLASRDPALSVIAREPGTARFGSFSFGANGIPNIRTAVVRYLTRAAIQEPGTVPMLPLSKAVAGNALG